MGFKAPPSGGDYKPLAAGVYAGVCALLVDVGVQKQNNPKFKDTNKIVLGFELPDAPERDDGKPTMIYKTLTLSMNKKGNLRKLIESWFGKQFPSDEAANDFDLDKLLGKAALVNVTNDERGGKVYANIGGLTPLMAGMAAPKAKGATLFYSDKAPEMSGSLGDAPEWIQKLHAEQIRPETPVAAALEGADGGDDIPF